MPISGTEPPRDVREVFWGADIAGERLEVPCEVLPKRNRGADLREDHRAGGKRLGLQLAKDFTRFQGRMDKLSTHINQAKDDVDKVHVSATKITRRFEKIESVELEQNPSRAVEHDKEAGD